MGVVEDECRLELVSRSWLSEKVTLLGGFVGGLTAGLAGGLAGGSAEGSAGGLAGLERRVSRDWIARRLISYCLAESTTSSSSSIRRRLEWLRRRINCGMDRERGVWINRNEG